MAKRQEDVREAISLASIWICYVVGAALGTIAKRRWELKCLYIPVVMLVFIIIVDQFFPIAVQEEAAQET